MAALTKEQKLQKELNDVTKAIKHSLDDAGITNTEVAAVVGIDQSNVSRQLNNKAQLSMKVYLAAQMLLENR